MLVYSYDKNGWYLGNNQAHPNQLEKGKWLLPANSTFIAPPNAGPNQRARWVSGKWSVALAPDYAVNQIVVFYSLSDDNKVIWSGLPPFGKTDNINDPAGEAHIVLPPGSQGSVFNADGVQTMKVSGGKVIARDASSISSDTAAIPAIAYKKATGKTYDPGSHAASMTQAMYHAMNIRGSNTPEQQIAAEAQLKTLANAYEALQSALTKIKD